MKRIVCCDGNRDSHSHQHRHFWFPFDVKNIFVLISASCSLTKCSQLVHLLYAGRCRARPGVYTVVVEPCRDQYR